MCLSLFGLIQSAQADNILVFGQSNNTQFFVATRAGSSTTLKGTNIDVTVTQFAGVGGPSTPFAAVLNLNAVSSGPAGTVPFISQPYDGTISITSGTTNYLTAVFSGVTFGQQSASSASLQSSQPPSTIIFTSDFVLPNDLPRAMALSFTNLTNTEGGIGLQVVSDTIASFKANGSGTFSAEQGAGQEVPEPATIVMASMGGLALIGLGWRRRKIATA